MPCFFERDSTLKYYRIAVLDEPEAPLRGYWETSFKFIDEARKQGHAVLVHCKMGVSRSASTVIAYLMKSQRWVSTTQELLSHGSSLAPFSS